jgi:endonuclease-3
MCSRVWSRKSQVQQSRRLRSISGAGEPLVTRRPSVATQKLMLGKILRRFPVRYRIGSSTAFEALIRTILSQNTSDVNSNRAMKRLESRFDITPETLSRASVEELVECIRSAGLYRVKAPRIKQVSSIILDQFGGDLDSVLKRGPTEARSIMTELPGVGYKTADIVLAFVAGHPTIPVDTHVTRVSKRLGIVRKNARYEEIRLALERLIPPNRRLRMHLSLIRFGREICKAPRPLCPQCLLNKTCPSSTTRVRRARSMT